jgi:hypothetical protein
MSWRTLQPCYESETPNQNDPFAFDPNRWDSTFPCRGLERARVSVRKLFAPTSLNQIRPARQTPAIPDKPRHSYSKCLRIGILFEESSCFFLMESTKAMSCMEIDPQNFTPKIEVFHFSQNVNSNWHHISKMILDLRSPTLGGKRAKETNTTYPVKMLRSRSNTFRRGTDKWTHVSLPLEIYPRVYFVY